MSETKKKSKGAWVREVILADPKLDDEGVKVKVEELSGDSVSLTHVKRVRLRMGTEKATPEISIEKPDLPELPKDDEKKEEILEEKEEPTLKDLPKEGLELAEGFEFKQVGSMLAIPFRMVSSRTGFKGWELTDEEKKDLGEAWTPVINYYLPAVLAKHGALIYAGYVSLTIMGSKQMDYSDWKKKQAKEEETKEEEST